MPRLCAGDGERPAVAGRWRKISSTCRAPSPGCSATFFSNSERYSAMRSSLRALVQLATANEVDLERRDRAREVRSAVSRLPSRYREAILLFYFMEMNVAGAAGALGVGPPAPGTGVAATAHRAALGVARSGGPAADRVPMATPARRHRCLVRTDRRRRGNARQLGRRAAPAGAALGSPKGGRRRSPPSALRPSPPATGFTGAACADKLLACGKPPPATGSTGAACADRLLASQ